MPSEESNPDLMRANHRPNYSTWAHGSYFSSHWWFCVFFPPRSFKLGKSYWHVLLLLRTLVPAKLVRVLWRLFIAVPFSELRKLGLTEDTKERVEVTASSTTLNGEKSHPCCAAGRHCFNLLTINKVFRIMHSSVSVHCLWALYPFAWMETG